MANLQTMEVPIQGMDCAECTRHVQQAIAALPGVDSVDVYLAGEKARVCLDSEQVDLPAIRKAVEGAGYRVGETSPGGQIGSEAAPRLFPSNLDPAGRVIWVRFVRGNRRGVAGAVRNAERTPTLVGRVGIGDRRRISGVPQCGPGGLEAPGDCAHADDPGGRGGPGGGPMGDGFDGGALYAGR